MRNWITAAAAAALLAGAALSTAGEDGAKSRGAELLMPFKKELQKALREGLSRGPDEAIGVCKVKAPEIAARLSTDGVRMGRTSHKLRNPSNTAPGWAAPILAEYVSDPTARSPREIALPEGRYGYTEPIMVQGMCLACHGEKVAPAIAAKIEEHYPDDQATGFRKDDFRGLFWVEYPTHK